jgi:hypothetical protein
MSKSLNNSVLDAALNKVATGTIMTICSSQPTSRTEAVTTYALADVTLTGGDFTLANGDTSGRKVTIAQKTTIPIDTTGTANHIAICDSTDLLLVTTCASQQLIQGGTVTNPAFKYEITSPI